MSNYRLPKFPLVFLALTVAGAAVFLTGCRSSESSGPLTETEKKSMTTKGAPPPEAMEAMKRANSSGPPSGKAKSPWSK